MRIQIKILTVLGISLVLLMSFATPALAGTEPSPWQPQINELYAVVNDLAAIRTQLNSGSIRMGVDPSPFQPVVNHLNAIVMQLGVLYGRVDAALTGVPPGDPDIAIAMQNVRDGAQGVFSDAVALDRILPEECHEALGDVEAGALSIISLLIPQLHIPDVALLEGNDGVTDVWYKMALSAPSTLTVTVDCYTSAGTATPSDDFVSIPITAPITVTFLPGQTTSGFYVQIIGDTIIEEDETFFVNVVNPVNVILSRSRGQFTIWNDDFDP